MNNIAGYQSKILTDYYNIKKYNNDYYKLTYFKYGQKNSCFEDEEDRIVSRNINDEKLENNLSRTKSKVHEYGASNKFDYFITLTLDPKKYDRHDLSAYIKNLGQYIRNQRKKYNADIQYLLIPEPHKDGAWHMHGLIKGMHKEQLKLFTLEDKLPYRILELIKKGHKIYNWTNYAEKFGFNTLEEIKSVNAVSKYITKYVSKVLVDDLSREKEKHLYYVTRGLKTAKKVKEGYMSSSQLENITFNYENDYIKLKDLNSQEYLEIINQL